MPASVFEVFEQLRDELVGIHARWALHRRMFGFDEGRIDLLNSTAQMLVCGLSEGCDSDKLRTWTSHQQVAYVSQIR
jgi:hypothetical protein